MTQKELILFYGPNGSGKTTIARYLATKNKGLHIELDLYSSMHRGKEWHTRKNNKDKINLLLGTLDSAVQKTNYKKIYIDGVLIYPFMFKMISEWCEKNKIKFKFIKLTGNNNTLADRIKKRKMTKKVNWNKKLPEIYSKFTHKNSLEIDTTDKDIKAILRNLT